MAHIFTFKSAIEARLAANWATTPILYENMSMDLIKTNGAMPESFVMIEIVPYENTQRSIGDDGNRLYTTEGFIYLHIFTPAGSGAGLSDEYADSLGQIFRGKEFDGVVCYGISPFGEAGSGDDEGRYWRTSLKCRFDFDQTF